MHKSPSRQYIQYSMCNTAYDIINPCITIKRFSAHIDSMSHSFCVRSVGEGIIYCWCRHNVIMWRDSCETSTRKAISNSLNINFINGDIHGRSCKKYNISSILLSAKSCVDAITHATKWHHICLQSNWFKEPVINSLNLTTSGNMMCDLEGDNISDNYNYQNLSQIYL